MKKFLICFLICVLLFCSFVSCSNSYENIEDCSNFNAFINNVNKYKMITTFTDEDYTLNGEYNVEYVKDGFIVSYEFETLNVIEADNKNQQFKKNNVGNAIIENGQVKSFDGDELLFVPQKINMNFNCDYFSSIKNENGNFKAKVINANKFLNSTKQINDLWVDVSYTLEFFETITLSYNADNMKVTISYAFN